MDFAAVAQGGLEEVLRHLLSASGRAGGVAWAGHSCLDLCTGETKFHEPSMGREQPVIAMGRDRGKTQS